MRPQDSNLRSQEKQIFLFQILITGPPTRWLGDFMYNLEKVTYGHLSRREIDETIGVQKL